MTGLAAQLANAMPGVFFSRCVPRRCHAERSRCRGNHKHCHAEPVRFAQGKLREASRQFEGPPLGRKDDCRDSCFVLGKGYGNKSQAARLLGLSRNAFRYRLSKLGVPDEPEL